MLVLGTNSYVTLEEANAYAAEQGLAVVSDEQFLIRATKWIDRTYGHRFMGVRYATDQSLAWPRQDVSRLDFDADSDWIDLNTIPTAVKEATIEAAAMLQAGTSLYVQPSPAVIEESSQVDVLSIHKVYAGAYRPMSGDVDLYKIELILRPVLARSSIRLVR